MNKLQRSDLLSLEDYAERRGEFRARVMQHKKDRKILVGPNAYFIFEDKLTIQYQIQEMLRVERIFEKTGIEEELQAYNPLIPDGNNLKATFMIEYEDPAERKVALAKLRDIENKVWMKVEGFDPVYAIADEDLERANEEKTSSVHFLRFDFSPEQITSLKQGAGLSLGIDHDAYRYDLLLDPAVKQALTRDFS